MAIQKKNVFYTIRKIKIEQNYCRLTWHCQTLTQILAAAEHRCDIRWYIFCVMT